ncbi:hypothetical protein EOD42_16915 [Rhodovarius crocodyli]|uniref:Uncharacterized protein n=1 Tax=Rhodovarius crocodyli TaxID=1979269 RepID=A0A437MCB7_9PROT|nr:hypothetical protein [Rhodovarius crocodyli]RVT95265.1 hypothetical protein EOD42_16915 [Rhodovarius crocodyli]
MTYFDWPVTVGDNDVRLFFVPEGDTSMDLTGSTLRLSITWSGGEIVLSSASPVVIDDLQYGIWLEDQANPLTTGFFGVRLTVEQTDMLPNEPNWFGRAGTYNPPPERARYEVQYEVDGASAVIVAGTVIATKWITPNG